MDPKIKTTNNEWRNKAYILGSVLIIILILFLVYFLYTTGKYETQIQQDKTHWIEVGQNSTENYIIGNEKYPAKFKGNIVWLTKNELCEDD